MEDEYSVLKSLGINKNLIIKGPPGTGKSRILNRVATVFEGPNGGILRPTLNPNAQIPIPATYGNIINGVCYLALEKTNRKVFRTSFHKNYKYKDFLNGVTPNPTNPGSFKITEGILYRANEYAKQDDSAALLIIDELNRGPAVEIFGGSLVALEPDKRLDDDNRISDKTQSFEIINPETGSLMDYHFSPNLYILAAMNNADTTVAPLDTAFLRRFGEIKLTPEYDNLYNLFQIPRNHVISDDQTDITNILTVAINALIKTNKFLYVTNGEDYQLGPGIFYSIPLNDFTLEEVKSYLCEVWTRIFAHIQEIYYGDDESIGALLNVQTNISPYKLTEYNLPFQTTVRLNTPRITPDNIFNVYYSIATLDL